MLNNLNKFSSHVDLRIAIGIVVIVALMLSLTVAGVNYMSQVNNGMNDIVNNNNVKMEMAHDMKNALRERALNMYIMTIVDDPFLKDDEFQRFNIHATEYYQARKKMEGLVSTPEEKEILTKIGTLTRSAQREVQEVVDLLLKGNALHHYDTIRNEVMPKQKLINDQVIELVALQKIQTSNAVNDAESSYQYARKLMLALGGIASLLVIIVAALVGKKVSKQAHDLQHQAFHDELTDLPNRALFMDRLNHAIIRSLREDLKFTIILLDLNRFKEVNDTLGHNVGDLLLKEVSSRLLHTVRESDTVARLGGDEFVILLEKLDLEHAPSFAEKLSNSLDRPFNLADQNIDVSASFGLAYFPEHGVDSISLLQKADVAMYSAKQNHASYAVYSGTLDKSSRSALTFKSEFLQAIDCDELVLYFQPKINLGSGRISGVEALVRWKHPERGFLAPDLFIPMAEQSGLIDQMTFWVLKHALLQCAAFKSAGMEITVAINLSARSLRDTRLPGEILRRLVNAGIEPSMLVLEITESAVMSDPVATLEVLEVLDNMGFVLSIDDYGTGYSSLAYLMKLPVDEIKIDKSFVLGMAEDRSSAVIVRSTIDLGHNLGKKVVAEGVETLEMWNALAEWGCDTAQGYYMGKPMPAVQLMTWLKESTWK